MKPSRLLFFFLALTFTAACEKSLDLGVSPDSGASGGGAGGGGGSGGGGGGGGSTDACSTVVCTRPAATCASSTSVKTYSSGICAQGVCSYEPTITPCDQGEICNAGACKWNDASLTGLSVSPGSLPFSPSRTKYVVALPIGTLQLEVTATVPRPDRSTLKVNGVTATSGSAQAVALVQGSATVELAVEAESGSTQTYQINAITLEQQVYAKASNADAQDFFSAALALSDDGNTLVVGASGESSKATGIGGDQSNNLAANSGAVYVFTRAANTWSQQAYIKASNTEAGDMFGYSVALSGDGLTLVVGAPFESSAATGVNGDQADNSASSSGAVYIFSSASGTWAQDVYLKASNAEADDQFGNSVAISSDGSTIAVGAGFEDSGSGGINGNQADNSVVESGAVYVFGRTASGWAQSAYLKASTPVADSLFGRTPLTLSADGSTLAVGAADEDTSTVFGCGAVYIFARDSSQWAQQAYLLPKFGDVLSLFGSAVSLSSDGTKLAVGWPYENGGSNGINGDATNKLANASGAVVIYERGSGGSWVQKAYVKASNTGQNDAFGFSVALSKDGAHLMVGAAGESSGAPGIEGNQSDDSVPSAGAVYLFSSSAGAWSQEAYVKASNPAYAAFGGTTAISTDLHTWVVGAYGEPSNASGINANQYGTPAAKSSGAVYVFGR